MAGRHFTVPHDPNAAVVTRLLCGAAVLNSMGWFSERCAIVFVLIISQVGFCGCASTKTKATILDPQVTHKAVAPESVVIYPSADRVPREYEEIALLDTRSTVWRSEDAALASIRKAAAALGANGVILDPAFEPTPGAKVASMLLLGLDVVGRKAVAIKVLPPTAPTP